MPPARPTWCAPAWRWPSRPARRTRHRLRASAAQRRAGRPQPQLLHRPERRRAGRAVRALGHRRRDQVPHRPGPPGVPVGTLVARGEVELGFQQLSELIHVRGIDLLGPMPAAIQIVTTFSGGVCSGSTQAETARAMLAFDGLARGRRGAARPGHGPGSTQLAGNLGIMKKQDNAPLDVQAFFNAQGFSGYQWLIFGLHASWWCCSTASTPPPSATSRRR